MSDQRETRPAAAAAREEAARELAGTLVNVAVIVAASMLVQHADQIRIAGRRLWDRRPARRRPVDELAVCEHARRVADYSRGATDG